MGNSHARGSPSSVSVTIRNILLLCCICSVIVCPTFLARMSPPVLNGFVEPVEVYVKPHVFTGGWAVRETCQRRGGLDVLFFVYTVPENKQRRFAGRDTIGDPFIAEHWNWSTVYFVGLTDNEIDATWNRLEAEALGDLVILPINDTLRNLSYKYLLGIEWVLSNCPTVKHVVKLDDDVFVNPSLLRLYLEAFVGSHGKDLHCYVWDMNKVERDVNTTFFLSRDDFPNEVYFTYCSGRAVIMPGDVLMDLYAASKKLRPHATDDAYVTGDLALIARIGHVDMSSMITWSDRQEFDVVAGKFIFAHLDQDDNFVVRLGLWDLILMKEALRGSDEKWLLRKRVEHFKRSGTVNVGDAGVIRVTKPGFSAYA